MEVLNSQLCKKIFCVIPFHSNEATCNKNLTLAYKCCKGHSLNVVWIPENECLELKPIKEHVFILSEFSSLLIEFLQSYECTVVGPLCLLDSIYNCNPILVKAILQQEPLSARTSCSKTVQCFKILIYFILSCFITGES